MSSTFASNTLPLSYTWVTFIPYENGLMPIFVRSADWDADTFEPALHTVTSAMSSTEPLTIFVGMFRVWKKFVCDGSMPVGPAGSFTSHIEMTPALAAAGFTLLVQIVRISSMSEWQNTKPMLPFTMSMRLWRFRCGAFSMWFFRQVRIIVFFPIRIVALPRSAIRISCICFEPTKSTWMTSIFGHDSMRLMSFSKYAGFFDFTTIAMQKEP